MNSSGGPTKRAGAASPGAGSCRFSPEDAVSIEEVLTYLEWQAGELSPESKVAPVWRDWASLLAGRPLPWQTPWELPVAELPTCA
jgi:hypothetical protein